MRTIRNTMTMVWAAAFAAVTSASGVTFTNLYNFSVDTFSGGSKPVSINSDGINPMGMVVAGNVIYGTAAYGGPNGDGTIFRLNTDGTHFTNLFSFNLGT